MADRKIISIDGMGGDHAPRIVVEGLELFAQRRADLQFLLHGDEAQLKALLANAPTAAPRTTVRHTDKTISMDAKPAEAVRRGKGSFILLFAPVFAALWTWLGSRRLDPNPTLKFGLGIIQVGVGFFMLTWGATFADGAFQVPIIFLILLNMFHTTGELFVSPVGLSAFSKLSVFRLLSTMMATWFLANAWAGYVSGIIAGMADTETIAGAALDNKAALFQAPQQAPWRSLAGKPAHEVRINGLATRADAEAVLAKIKPLEGVSGRVALSA